MSLVYVKNKNNGATYVYESSGFWDKNKQQARNKRKCIGKLDAVTGEFVPSKRLDPQQAAVRDPAVTASAQIVGPAMVLEAFSQRTGLNKILKTCFPGTHRQILAMANYLSIETGALSHCESWAKIARSGALSCHANLQKQNGLKSMVYKEYEPVAEIF